MITNREFQDILKQYPDDAEVKVYCFDSFGDIETHELGENRICYDKYGDIVIDATNT